MDNEHSEHGQIQRASSQDENNEQTVQTVQPVKSQGLHELGEAEEAVKRKKPATLKQKISLICFFIVIFAVWGWLVDLYSWIDYDLGSSGNYSSMIGDGLGLSPYTGIADLPTQSKEYIESLVKEQEDFYVEYPEMAERIIKSLEKEYGEGVTTPGHVDIKAGEKAIAISNAIELNAETLTAKQLPSLTVNGHKLQIGSTTLEQARKWFGGEDSKGATVPYFDVYTPYIANWYGTPGTESTGKMQLRFIDYHGEQVLSEMTINYGYRSNKRIMKDQEYKIKELPIGSWYDGLFMVNVSSRVTENTSGTKRRCEYNKGYNTYYAEVEVGLSYPSGKKFFSGFAFRTELQDNERLVELFDYYHNDSNQQ